MILKYGTFAFPQNKVWVEFRRQNVNNSRGRRMFQVVTALFGGTVTGSSLSALDTAIDGVEDALAINDQDFVLYRNDGTTPTKHAIESAATMDGVNVKFLRWLKGSTAGTRGNGREYDNKRSFVAMVQAEIAANEVEIVEWKEEIEQFGGGGSDFSIRTSMTGAPQNQSTQNATGVVVVQQGSAVGWSEYPDFPASVIPLAFRSKEARFWKATPTIGRNENRLYPIRWRYVHEMGASPGVLTPTLP